MGIFSQKNLRGSASYDYPDLDNPNVNTEYKLGLGNMDVLHLNLTGEAEGSLGSLVNNGDFKIYPLKNVFVSSELKLGSGSNFRALQLRFGVIDPYRDYSGRLPDKANQADELLHDRDVSPAGLKRPDNHESGGSELGGSFSLTRGNLTGYTALTTANPNTKGLLTWDKNQGQKTNTSVLFNKPDGRYWTLGSQYGNKDNKFGVNLSYSHRNDSNDQPINNINLAIGKTNDISQSTVALEVSRTWGSDYANKFDLTHTESTASDTIINGALGLSFKDDRFFIPAGFTLHIFPAEKEVDPSSVSTTGFNTVSFGDPEWRRETKNTLALETAPSINFANNHFALSVPNQLTIKGHHTEYKAGLSFSGKI